MGEGREWKVTKNGELWTDRFTTENSAIEYAEECEREDSLSYFEVKEMTQAEIDVYDKGVI